MHGTRMIFHFSDEDEPTDSAVVVLDANSPETSSESDTLEHGVLPGPAAPIPARSEADLAGQGEDCLRGESPVVSEEQPEVPLGDRDSARQGLPPKRPLAHHRRLANSRMWGGGRRAEPHRPRRAVAFGAFGVLVVLVAMIVVHPGRSGVAPQTPPSAQSAALAGSAPVASPAVAAKRVYRPASARHRDSRRLAAFPVAHRSRRVVPLTSSNHPSVVEPQVRPAVSASEVPTATPTPTPSAAPTPASAREVPPSRPEAASTQSPSDGYAEFSFER